MRFLVATAADLPPVDEPVAVLVVDEPSRFATDELERVLAVPHRHRVDLGLGCRDGNDQREYRTHRDPDETVSLSAFDHDIGLLVAGLLDGELERRQPLTRTRWFRKQLGVADVRLSQMCVSEMRFRMMAWQLQDLIDRYEPTAMRDGEGGPVPGWMSIELPDGAVQVPLSMWVVFPAGTVMAHPCGFSVERARDGSYWFGFCVPGAASGALDQMMDRLREWRGDNPYRGQTLEVMTADKGIDIRLAETRREDRDTLMLPDEIWREIDENVTNLFANRDLLTRLGLGLNRGLLLTGPPGTGKTHLTRVLAAELAGRATVLFVAPKAMSKELRAVYRLAEQLSPSLVVLEDVDLAVGSRNDGGSTALNEFLTAVDGVMTAHTGIVTVATTNDVRAIDEAAKRAARFDRIIEVPLPPTRGRARIWQHYLDRLSGDFDVDRLVHATAGGSGADIREIVRHAILATNGQVTTQVLLRLAKARGLGGHQHVGQYL